MKDQMTRRRVLAGVGAMMAAGVAGCGTTRGSDSSEGTNQGDTMEDVEIVEHELYRDDLDNASVDVLVENTGTDELDYLEAQVVVFNADDERVGDGLANTTNVRPGEQVRFDVFTSTDFAKVDHYEVNARTSV